MNKANKERIIENRNRIDTTNNKKRKNKKPKKRRFLRFILKLLLLFIIAILILGAVFFYKVQANGGGVKGALITVMGLSVEEVNELDTINVLVLGVSQDIDTVLTDTIIVCSYNPKNQKATMISIPRDTFIGNKKSNAKGSDKINSLYSKSPEKLLKKVSEITGIDLDYYVVINTNTLVEIVNIVGGINYNVPIDMNYDDPTQNLHIHLKKGYQLIDGPKAEQLLRFRHNNDGSSYPSEYGDNDYGRMRTQREFMVETLKQSIDIKNLKNSKNILETIFNNIETNLEKEQIKLYIPTIIDFNTNNITSKQLPGQSEKCNELWFFIYDKKETKKMIEELEEDIKN